MIVLLFLDIIAIIVPIVLLIVGYAIEEHLEKKKQNKPIKLVRL